MASGKLTGATEEEVEQLRLEWEAKDKDMPFEERYCLAEIPRQPEEYDGPTRYCQKRNTFKIGDSWRCKYHGGKGHGNAENLKKLGNMSHGMKATRDHLVEDFDAKDRALYDWVVDSYTDGYDLDPSTDPNVAYDLHRLAAEIVRAERGRGHLIREGEVTEQEVYGDDGIVVDANGDIVTEKSEHYLHDMLYRQDNKITKLQKELGVTRKERERRAETDDAVEAIKQFSQLGSKFLDRESKDYDAEDEPWSESDSDASS